jgi:hypothetical protein
VTIHAFTSFSFSYLNRARVWANSIRRYHPDWVVWAVITDKEPAGFLFDLAHEPFDKLLKVEDLYGDMTEQWLFGHDVVEACTAVKGRALLQIMAEPDAEKIFYFDPDTAVFNDMTPVLEILDTFSIVLTPHQIDPEDADDFSAIMDNEVAALQYGAFNLGFIAVANDSEARRFATWWKERLDDWCHDSLDVGIFVDQKWCNLIPCFFDRVMILRDPGYNVASWNLSKRTLYFNDSGTCLVNTYPLRFYHFTKLGPIGDAMTSRYAKDNTEVYEIWSSYRRWIAEETDSRIPPGYWHYGRSTTGSVIRKSIREIYRSQTNLRAVYPNPFDDYEHLIEWAITTGALPPDS